MDKFEDNKKASINDVAKHAQVSKSTVSRYISAQGYVSIDAQKKIKKAIETLNYTPSLIARSLRKKTGNILGVLINRLDSPSESEVLRGILETAEINNMDVLISESLFSKTKSEKELEIFKQKGIDYLIIFADTEQDYSWLSTWKIPIILMGYESSNFSSVVFDHKNAVSLLYNYLRDKGCEKIAFLGIDDKDKTTGLLRNLSYLENCALHHQDPIVYLLDHTAIAIHSFKESYKIGCFFVSQDIDSIICVTDSFAAGMIKFFQERNQAQPLICGIGAMPLLKFLYSDFISIDLNYKQSGIKSVELLLEHKISSFTTPCSINH